MDLDAILFIGNLANSSVYGKQHIYVGGSVGRRGTFKLRLVTLTGMVP
jgi:hypothetical protein